MERTKNEAARMAGAQRLSGNVWAQIVLIAVLALGLRLYQLGHENFWIDEISSIEVAAQPLPELIHNYRPGHHPWRGAEQAPLAFIVMHFFLSPAISEASARLPSALLGTLGVVALFLFARRLFRPPVPLVAALLLALSPLHVWYSQEARWYAHWLLLSVLSYWALLSAWETGRLRMWVAYWLCSVLSVYTFILSFLVIACQGASLLLLQLLCARRRRAVRAFVLVQLAVVAGAAPVIWMILNTLGLTTGTPRSTVLAEVPYTFFVYAAGYSSGPTTEFLHALPSLLAILTHYPIVVVFAAVFAPLLVLGTRRVLANPSAAIILLPWCFGLPLLSFLISLGSNVTYQARYSSAALPAFLLLVTLGACSLRWRALRVSAIVAVAACFLTSLANYYWNPQYAKEDVRGAVTHVKATGLDATPVVVVGQVASAVEYYGPRLRVIPVDDCARDATTAAPLRSTQGQPLWLLVGRDWKNQASTCLERVSKTHTAVERRSFPGVDLWLFQSTNGARQATAMPARASAPPGPDVARPSNG